MNSQHIVLRNLERMRDISPDYLQGFMSYIDTWIGLENPAPTKPASVHATWGETEKTTHAKTQRYQAVKQGSGVR